MVGIFVSLLPFAVLTILWILLMRYLQVRRPNDSLAQEPEPRSESVETNEARTGAGTTHTYRDPDTLTRGAARFLRSALFPLVVIVVLVAAAGAALGSFTWEDAKGLGSALVFFAVLCGYGLLQERHSWCREIRLSDDGTCELETKSRVVRLHVNEIRSVKYSRGDESESYTIRYQGGKLNVSERIAGFADFLGRLKTLNPAVDLTGFPAEALPAGVPETKEPWSVTRLFRIALFPLIVIAMLVYLASQTFIGN